MWGCGLWVCGLCAARVGSLERTCWTGVACSKIWTNLFMYPLLLTSPPEGSTTSRFVCALWAWLDSRHCCGCGPVQALASLQPVVTGIHLLNARFHLISLKPTLSLHNLLPVMVRVAGKVRVLSRFYCVGTHGREREPGIHCLRARQKSPEFW